MIRFALIAVLFALPASALAQDAGKMTDKEYKELVAKSPFNYMYPKSLAPEAAKYFGAFNKELFKTGPIAEKEARLAAISASAAIRCEYCITAQVKLAKAAGASDDEIKAAVQISAEIARFSILLYGHEFGQEKLNKILDGMINKAKK